jgi:hypothetical protein
MKKLNVKEVEIYTKMYNHANTELTKFGRPNLDMRVLEDNSDMVFTFNGKAGEDHITRPELIGITTFKLSDIRKDYYIRKNTNNPLPLSTVVLEFEVLNSASITKKRSIINLQGDSAKYERKESIAYFDKFAEMVQDFKDAGCPTCDDPKIKELRAKTY